MAHLRNPTSGTSEKYIYLDSPETAQELARLRLDLERERLKPAFKEVVTVDRVVERVVYQDDPELLHRFNVMAKENGELKTRLRRISSPVVAEVKSEPQTVVNEVIRIVRVEVVNRKYIILSAALGAISWPTFSLLGRLILSHLR